MYHPQLGRFMQRDPIGYGDLSADEPIPEQSATPMATPNVGMNLYEYVKSNPIRYVDPMGTHTCDSAQYDFIPVGTDLLDFTGQKVVAPEGIDFFDCYACCVHRNFGTGGLLTVGGCALRPPRWKPRGGFARLGRARTMSYWVYRAQQAGWSRQAIQRLRWLGRAGIVLNYIEGIFAYTSIGLCGGVCMEAVGDRPH